MKNTVGWNS